MTGDRLKMKVKRPAGTGIKDFVRKNDLLMIPTKFYYAVIDGKKKKTPCFLKKIRMANGDMKFSPNFSTPFYKWDSDMIKKHIKFLDENNKLNDCDGVIVILWNTKYIMVDTDDELGEKEIGNMDLFKNSPRTKSLLKPFGRHRYIKLNKTGNYKADIKINGKEIDIITEYVFEGMNSACENIKNEDAIDINDFNKALNIKLIKKEVNDEKVKKINNSLDKKFKINDTIRNDFLDIDETIEEGILFRLIDGLDVNKFSGNKMWFSLLAGIYNQATSLEQDTTYRIKFSEFMATHNDWTNNWDKENLATWNNLKNKNTSKEGKAKSGTLWRYLQEQNQSLFIELKGLRRRAIHPKTFNLMKYYDTQKKEFERYNFVVKSEKNTFCEMDNVAGELKERTIENFKTNYLNLNTTITVEDKKGKVEKKIPFTDKWCSDEDRREYDRMDFLPPPRKCNPYTYNLYDGLYIDDIDNKEFDGMNEIEREDRCDRIFNHINYLVGCDDDCYNYFMKMLAYKYRFPAELHKVSAVFKSKQGCGKNALLDWFGEKILGEKYYCCSANADDFVGKFNSMIKGKLLIVFNEMDGQVGYNHSARLKEFATEETILHEKKGVDRKKITNCAFTCYASNSNNPVKVEIGDRRFFVVECSDRVLYIENYFENLFDDLEDPCVAKCFCWYLENKVEVNQSYNFKRNRPFTRAYKELQYNNKSQLVRFIEWYYSSQSLVIEERNYEKYKLWELFVNYQEDHKVKNKWDYKSFENELKKYTYKDIKKLGNKDIDKVIRHFASNSSYKYTFNKARCAELIKSYDLDRDYDFTDEEGEDSEESDNFEDSDY